jgi:hypothetical protein
MDQVLKFLPIGAAAVAIIAAASVGQFQLGAIAAETVENARDIEENEDDIEDIQRSLIKRQGEIGLDLERLRIEQSAQGSKIDQVLELLRQED